MNELPRYYTILFKAVEEAVAAMERMDFGIAKSLLIRGQLHAEGVYAAMGERRNKETEKL